ncbi:glycosyltransferase [Pontiella agarivorans]|uniref:Glycosyltransferase n=1 Tax=Pontiella agarivorans TaxID=3038953 RepID=A0ABU5N086_9BACT|nr:glycosyltransferase [Pontiella agarivorans]MDZ8119823.1 glycosyltransferase [Pontiella agarivorans]
MTAQPVHPVDCAPVLISVYDRKAHLQRCIEALSKNREAARTTLYIVSDGAKEEHHKPAIDATREYIRTIDGFKAVKMRFRDKNWGMRASALDAINWVMSENDRMIRMEDDIICSPYYLDFMNRALSTFEHDPRIFGICAHTHPRFTPPESYPHDIHLWQSFSTWGFAIWKNRWTAFLADSETDHLQLKDPRQWKKFRSNRPILGTQARYTRGNLHLDARLNLHVFLTGRYAVFPNRTLTVNSGFDGSGTHCGTGITYARQTLNPHPVNLPAHIEPSKKIQHRLYNTHFSLLNHGVGSVLRKLGIFDPLFNAYKQITGTNRTAAEK